DEASAASGLAFVQQPTSGPVGNTIAPPVTVQVVDPSGQPEGGTFTVTLGLGANPGGGTLGGTLTRTTNAAGLATFDDLSISAQGKGYTLVASATGFTGAPSADFNQTGDARQLAIEQQPTSGTAGAVISPPVTVQVQDASGSPLSGTF